MSRRALAVLALVMMSASLAGCADAVTAPPQPTLAPATPRPDLIEGSSCPGGYILSEGRCA